MLSATDQQSYDLAKDKLDKTTKELKSLQLPDEEAPIDTPRITVTKPDGTVMYDSSKNTLDSNGDVTSTENTFGNFTSKAIGDNKNTRKANMESLLNDDGEGMEVKPSTTTGTTQAYVNQLLEEEPDNEGESLPQGAVRLSEQVDKTSDAEQDAASEAEPEENEADNIDNEPPQPNVDLM